MYLRRLKKFAEMLIDREFRKYRIIINNPSILINSLFARELTLASNQQMTKMGTFPWTILSRRIHLYSLKSATALLRCFRTSVAANPSLMIMIWWIKMIMTMFATTIMNAKKNVIMNVKKNATKTKFKLKRKFLQS
jgi:hypothetical protein